MKHAKDKNGIVCFGIGKIFVYMLGNSHTIRLFTSAARRCVILTIDFCGTIRLKAICLFGV